VSYSFSLHLQLFSVLFRELTSRVLCLYCDQVPLLVGQQYVLVSYTRLESFEIEEELILVE